MKRLITIVVIYILSISSAHALQIYKVSADYEIHVEMKSTVRTVIKLKDMEKKTYIKAWLEQVIGIDDAGNPDLAGNQFSTSANFGSNNYQLNYKFYIQTPFVIAKKIQDAGLIPEIRYDGMLRIDKDGVFQAPSTMTPTGTWARRGAYTFTEKRWYYDYIIQTGMTPIMSSDGNSVDHWEASFQILKTTGVVGPSMKTRLMTVWIPTEQDPLNFDLTEPADHTKSKIIMSSTTWLEAQQDMFDISHEIAKQIASNGVSLPKITIDPIFFTSPKNVKLIDLSDGIIPTGDMITLTKLNAPTLSSPNIDATNLITTQNMTWFSALNATSYKLQISENNTFSSMVVNENVGNILSKQVSLQTSKTYYWRVQAIGDGIQYADSDYSPVRNFTTTDAVAHNYYRIRATQAGWGSGEPYAFGQYELKLYSGINGTGTQILNNTSVITASSSQVSNLATTLSDGNWLTGWWQSASHVNTTLAWIIINNPTNTIIRSIRMVIDSGPTLGSYIPKEFVVEGCIIQDCTNPTLIKTFTTEQYTGATKWWTFELTQ